MLNTPLSEPGVTRSGKPVKSFDQAPRARRGFSYQDYAAFMFLLKSMSDGQYLELWLEHHEDILAVRSDGLYDLYQVKTREVGDSQWMVNDAPIVKTLARFCLLEQEHGNAIAGFYIYSNVGPYVPAESALAAKRPQSIPMLAFELKEQGLPLSSPESAKAFAGLLGACGAADHILLRVLEKLKFIHGPAIDTFRSDWPTSLCFAEPRLERWSIKEVRDLESDLLRIIEAAGTANVPPLLLHTSTIQASALPEAEVLWRKIAVSAIKNRVENWIKRRERNRRVAAIGIASLITLIGGWLLRPVFQESPLQRALSTIQASGRGVLPAEFRESVAILRAARTPLHELNLNGANIACQDLSGMRMVRAQGESMHATGAEFDDSLLAGATFNNSELNGAKFRHARMDQAMFENSNMVVANFYGAEVRNARMSGVTLNGANLSRGVFSGGDFRRANFQLAEMAGTDFSNSDFKDADLREANISGADFTSTKNLTQEMLSSACINTTKPPLLDKPLKAPTRNCGATAKDKDDRMARRFAMLFVSQVAVAQGFCSDNELKVRLPDSKLYPESNEQIFMPDSELEDTPPRRH
jgi:uncharacterized protein YjbI with pentapeptide repeats